jgi:hypothetical protein
MEEKSFGWVVLSYNLPQSGKQIMFSNSFATTRNESIRLFVGNSGNAWKYWYRKYNYRCVKAQSIISTIKD